MRADFHHSLRQKMLWLVLLATGLAVLCVGVAIGFYELTTFRPRISVEMQERSLILAKVLRAPLQFGNEAGAQNYLETMRAIPEIAAAVLYKDGGENFATYLRPNVDRSVIPAGLSPAGTYFDGLQMTVWQPVMEDEKVLGRLLLVRDVKPWFQRLPQYGIMVCAVLLALAVVAFILNNGVRRDILRPLEALSETADKVTRDGDYSTRATVSQNDEIGRLSQAFNRMLEDISERDADLRHTNELSKRVFDATTEVGIIATDLKGLVTVFNTGAERMLGYQAEEIIGKVTPAHWHMPAECAQRGAELSANLGRPVQGFDVFAEPARLGLREGREWTFVRKDGRSFPVFLVVTAMRNVADQITGFLGMVSDITERKRVEIELQRREERFRSLIENASDMILVMNRDGVIRFLSPSSQSILGLSPVELTGRNGLEFIHPEDLAQARQNIQEALNSSREPVTMNFRLRHRNGSWRQIQAIGRSIPDESAEGYLILNARDVTDTNRLEEQFRQAQKMEAVGQLSGGVAHDFNNILTVIQGHVNLLDTHPSLPSELRESTKEIGQAAERAAGLTRQLLSFSRRQTLQTRNLDLNVVVADMSRMLRRVLREDVSMEILPSPQPLVVRADFGMMEQVMMNLVVNARDAMPDGGRLVLESAVREVDESIASQSPKARAGTFACLSVSDTGCGIPPEMLQRIFEPFFTTKSVGQGTGLGLATVDGIIAQHGGWVSVYSAVGKGTTFRVFLPLVAEPADRTPVRPASTAPQGGKETILLVEDEPSLRQLGVRFLKRLGYRVLEAPNGQAALPIWAEHRGEIRLLLTDMVMPGGMTGTQLAKLLLREAPDLKVIYTSGYSAEIAGKDLSLQEGVNFLVKPFELPRLANAVRVLLDQ
jgi:PAS domain S-box-containing protein